MSTGIPGVSEGKPNLTGTCQYCGNHRELTGCARCMREGRNLFMCWECYKAGKCGCKARPPLCDLCPSSHEIVGPIHTLEAGDVAKHPTAYATVVWEGLPAELRGKIEARGQKDAFFMEMESAAKTQYQGDAMESIILDPSIDSVHATLDLDAGMSDWAACDAAFQRFNELKVELYGSTVVSLEEGEPGTNSGEGETT